MRVIYPLYERPCIYNRAQLLSILTVATDIFICRRPFFHSRLNDRDGEASEPAGARTFLPSRAEIATREKELRSAYMTRLFTIHINRVRARTVVGVLAIIHGGPLYLARNTYVVSAMCHSRWRRAIARHEYLSAAIAK